MVLRPKVSIKIRLKRRTDRIKELSLAITYLPRDEQLVLCLRFEQNLSMSEIAASLDLPEPKVLGIYGSAMDKIKTEIERATT